jgi:hypothetical protein
MHAGARRFGDFFRSRGRALFVAPIQCAGAELVDQRDHEQHNENEYGGKAGPAQFEERDGPGQDEYCFEVEDHKQDCDHVEVYGELHLR